MSFVFISYSHKDSAFAKRLADSLEAKGLGVWIDERIHYGARWTQEIQERLDRCAAFVVVMTIDSFESLWVQNELAYAISMGKPIFPVCLEGPVWMAVAATQVAHATDGCLPSTGFYERVANVLSAGQIQLGSARSGSQDPDNLLPITEPIRLDLLRVPAGEFLMGSDPTKDGSAEEDEQPQHTVHLAEFYIGRYPVTNKQYAVFVHRTKWRAPHFWPHHQFPRDRENHPVVGVSLHDAQAFCEWLSDARTLHFRLPSEAEWEKAARGIDGRIYPWEDNRSFDVTQANYLGCQMSSTTPVDRYERGASVYGALDMVGNVWEWTRSLWGKDPVKPDFRYPYDPTDGREFLRAEEHVHCVVRGGSYDSPAPHLRCAFRDHLQPTHLHENVGFRVSITKAHE